MVILVDMDDTIEQLLKAWIARGNEKFGRNVQLEDVTDWNVAFPFPGIPKQEVYDLTYEPGFWSSIEPMPGAAEALKHLMDEGHEVYIVTSAEIEHVEEKMKGLLFRYFPFLSWEQVIITSKKQMIRGDVLIDDGPHNLEGGEYAKILLDAPYNRSYNAEANEMIRVYSWEEIERAVERIEAERMRAGEP